MWMHFSADLLNAVKNYVPTKTIYARARARPVWFTKNHYLREIANPSTGYLKGNKQTKKQIKLKQSNFN